LSRLERSLWDVDSLKHFINELLAFEFLVDIEVLRKLFLHDRVFILKLFNFVLSLRFVETIASEEPRDLLTDSLLVLGSREGLPERRNVEFNEKLVEHFVHLLVDDDLGSELQTAVAVLHVLLAFKVLPNRFIRK